MPSMDVPLISPIAVTIVVIVPSSKQFPEENSLLSFHYKLCYIAWAMTSVNSEFLNTLIERGFLHQCTDLEGLDARLRAGVVTAYNGFDPTGPSLHVGHLLPIMLLRWYQKCGHKPIVLIGGGTAKVGDPSGKDETRQLMTDEVIASNIASIREIFGRYLVFGDGATDAIMVDNAGWLDELKYIPCSGWPRRRCSRCRTPPGLPRRTACWPAGSAARCRRDPR